MAPTWCVPCMDRGMAVTPTHDLRGRLVCAFHNHEGGGAGHPLATEENR